MEHVTLVTPVRSLVWQEPHLMFSYVLMAADLAAVIFLVFGVFLRRHRRPELIAAYLGVNIGVLAVTFCLATGTVGAGLGLGLFGVLSIIRLRSQELSQSEVAYYFAALALGLLGGLSSGIGWLQLVMMAAIVAAVVVGDHPRIGRAPQTQEMLLDRAITNPSQLHDHLAGLLQADIVDITVRRTDLVNDTTLVEVRYRPRTDASTFDDHRMTEHLREVA